MDIAEHHVFEAPIEQVWAMFGDVESHVAKFAGMGHREIEVLAFDAAADRVEVTLRRLVDMEIPGFARKVLHPTNAVTSTDRWRADGDGYAGTWTMEVQGAPVTATGTTKLRPLGDGTRYDITVTVKVKVPVIGGRIESFAKGDVQRQLRQEFEAAERWLADHPAPAARPAAKKAPARKAPAKKAPAAKKAAASKRPTKKA